jgi:hypothetical protein
MDTKTSKQNTHHEFRDGPIHANANGECVIIEANHPESGDDAEVCLDMAEARAFHVWLGRVLGAPETSSPIASPPCVWRDGCRKPEVCAIKGYCDAPPARRREAETTPQHPDTERLNFLESECAELRCIQDRGPDDADLHYEVWKFFMQAPKERPVGMGSGPREAIDAAMNNDDDECIYCGQERNCGVCSPVKAGEKP